MATWDKPADRARQPRSRPPRPPRAARRARLRALFGEAWELQRRRRRRGFRRGAGLAALAASAAAIGLLIASAPDSPPARTLPAPAAFAPHGAVASVDLPAPANYASMAQVGNRLLIWGFHDPAGTGSAPFAAAGACTVATVVPATLALADVRRGSCQDPALFHERVLLDVGFTRGGDTGAIDDVRVSLATASGGFRVGPILARSPQCSDCQDAIAYGQGVLWIYIPTPLGAPRGTGELLAVSAHTGRLTHRWAMPSLVRALLGDDRDGLWIAPSLYSGTVFAHATPTELLAAESLYRITPGMRAPERTDRVATNLGGANWMVTAESTVWIDAGSPGQTTLTVLRGPDARPSVRANAGPAQCGELGDGTAAVGGSTSAGLDCLGETGPDSESSAVYHYSARTGRLTARTTLDVTPPDDNVPGTVSAGDFFFLDPSEAAENGDPGPAEGAGTRLFRVTPGP